MSQSDRFCRLTELTDRGAGADHFVARRARERFRRCIAKRQPVAGGQAGCRLRMEMYLDRFAIGAFAAGGCGLVEKRKAEKQGMGNAATASGIAIIMNKVGH